MVIEGENILNKLDYIREEADNLEAKLNIIKSLEEILYDLSITELDKENQKIIHLIITISNKINNFHSHYHNFVNAIYKNLPK